MRSASIICLLALSAGCTTEGADGVAPGPPSEQPPAESTISVDPQTSFQTISGWQSGTQAAHELDNYSSFQEELLDRAVFELGINRVRLGIRSGVENSRDFYADWLGGDIDDAEWRCNRYATVNDNGDPSNVDPTGFHFTETDLMIERIVIPLRERLQSIGEDLFIDLNYLAHISQNCPGTSYHHDDSPEEYAEVVLAAFLHLRDKYSIVPQAFELLNEPENTAFDTPGPELGRVLVAIRQRLEAEGFRPAFIAPSTTRSRNAVPYFDAMAEVPGAVESLSELSYHRYDNVTEGTLREIAQRAEQHGISTSMLEHNGSGVEDLYEDLTVANVSAWEQGALAFYKYSGFQDNGTIHYLIDNDDPAAPKVELMARSRLLRQYFRYIRAGAVRIGASTSEESFLPVAFIGSDGRYVVVVKADRGGSFPISGLPPGTYRLNYTTDSEFDVDAGSQTLTAGQVLSASIPDAGVLTVYQP